MTVYFLIAALAFSSDAAPTFEERKAEIRKLIDNRDFQPALERAISLNKEWPDDVVGYQLLTAARLGAGDYADAEKSAQWMIDMRIGKTDAPGWLLVAKIREATGDLDGAIDALNTGYGVLTPLESAEKLAMLTYSGELHLRAGKLAVATRLLQDRLKLGSDARASSALAAVFILDGKASEGVALLKQLAATHPHPRYLYQLAEATGAATDYAQFESAAKAIENEPDSANRELILYLSKQGNRPKDALVLALREVALRHDIQTQDALAVAYQANGKPAEARAALQRALAVGTRDPQVLRHAAELGLKP